MRKYKLTRYIITRVQYQFSFSFTNLILSFQSMSKWWAIHRRIRLMIRLRFWISAMKRNVIYMQNVFYIERHHCSDCYNYKLIIWHPNAHSAMNRSVSNCYYLIREIGNIIYSSSEKLWLLILKCFQVFWLSDSPVW